MLSCSILKLLPTQHSAIVKNSAKWPRCRVVFRSQMVWYTMVKSYKVLGLLRRVFSSVHCPRAETFSTYSWFFSLLYCSPICRPHLPFTILAPWKQRVQRRAIKFILNNYVSNCRLCLLDLNFLCITIEDPLYSVLRQVFERAIAPF